MTCPEPWARLEPVDSHEQSLRLTDAAIAHVKKIRQRENLAARGLRVSVTTGGCSGLSYKLDFDDAPKPEDVVLELDGLQVYVESSILQQLGGTVIDYVSELHGASFRFSNPNATGTCGCGTSFSA